MQFIPSTWPVVKVDADGDGKRNPQDIDDAALATAVYLCSGKDNLSQRGPGSAGLPLQPQPGLREPRAADHGGLHGRRLQRRAQRRQAAAGSSRPSRSRRSKPVRTPQVGSGPGAGRATAANPDPPSRARRRRPRAARRRPARPSRTRPRRPTPAATARGGRRSRPPRRRSRRCPRPLSRRWTRCSRSRRRSSSARPRGTGEPSQGQGRLGRVHRRLRRADPSLVHAPRRRPVVASRACPHASVNKRQVEVVRVNKQQLGSGLEHQGGPAGEPAPRPVDPLGDNQRVTPDRAASTDRVRRALRPRAGRHAGRGELPGPGLQRGRRHPPLHPVRAAAPGSPTSTATSTST